MSSVQERQRRRAIRVLRRMQVLRPRTADELHQFVRRAFAMRVPRVAMIEGNDAPFEYLLHTFFEGRGGSADVVVWANRGGGKTILGAVATVLDLLFKPGIQVRILGGSFEQSEKMYRYLLQFMNLPMLRGLLTRTPTHRRLALVNGSVVEVLRQSQRSVRGQHVHKMRCDELEDFKRDVWDAAQLVTQSQTLGGVAVRGAVEALSTMHRPFGLMSAVLARSGAAEGGGASAGKVGPRVLRWCVLDVIERCPPQRACESCVLWSDCQGRAKEADGFMRVDDAVDQWHRTSEDAWSAEMMCRRPRRDASVYHDFDAAPGGRHVVSTAPGGGEASLVSGLRAEARPLPCERGARRLWADRTELAEQEELVGGMDLGMRSPTVLLWARVRPPSGADKKTRMEDYLVDIVDEYSDDGLTLDRHLVQIEQRDWPRPAWIGIDPCGGHRNAQTGLSDFQVLRQRGYRLRYQRSTIRNGVERIRRRLDRGTLRIDPCCHGLIRAMSEYHFDVDHPDRPNPVKDGPDHYCDALRYLILNLELGPRAVQRAKYVRGG